MRARSDAPPMALTIAGSDSGGGAGVQADLRTFAALEVYGASVITALTAQSTTEVRDVLAVPASFVVSQLDTVLDDLPIRVAKTGMLHRQEIVGAVAERIRARGLVAVVDPVMIAESGARLLDPDAERAILERLVPAAALVTPNLPEAEALLGRPVQTEAEMVEAGRALIGRGAQAALIKGGHLAGAPTDVLVTTGGAVHLLKGARIDSHATHGTGCTYAAAIAAFLARDLPLLEAVDRAHTYLREAIAAGATVHIGRGKGPVHHMHPWYAWRVVSSEARATEVDPPPSSP